MQKKSVNQVVKQNQFENNLIVPIKNEYKSNQSYIDSKGKVNSVCIMFDIDVKRKTLTFTHNCFISDSIDFSDKSVEDFETIIATLYAQINAINFALKLLQD